MKKIAILLICCFLFGCTNNKNDNISTKTGNALQTDTKNSFLNQTGQSQTGTAHSQSGEKVVEPKKQEKALLVGDGTGNARNTLINFYNNINDKQYVKSIELFDEKMKRVKSVTDYFNEARLNRFVSALDGGLTIKNINQTPKDLIHDPSKNYNARYNYDLVYGIGGTLYVENWNMTVSFSSDKNLFTITSLNCQKNCGRYPFFNLDQFGVK